MTRATGLFAVAMLVACRPGSRDAVVPSAVDTHEFDGRYSLVVEESFAEFRKQVEAEPDPSRRATGENLLRMLADNWADLRVDHGVLHSGRVLVQELSFVSATRSGDRIAGTAVWHEDVHDPGDMSNVEVELRQNGDRLELRMSGGGDQSTATYVYSRRAE
jgi:hypothetical protein